MDLPGSPNTKRFATRGSFLGLAVAATMLVQAWSLGGCSGSAFTGERAPSGGRSGAGGARARGSGGAGPALDGGFDASAMGDGSGAGLPGSTGGSTTSNGSGGETAIESGTGSGGVPSATGCPESLPAGDAACATDALTCSYGTCCPTTAVCKAGAWVIAAPACPVPACPSAAPHTGDPCACMDGLSCNYDQCASGGQHLQAQCATGSWNVNGLACPAIACGTRSCDPADICMRVQIQMRQPSYECVTSVCRSTQPSCACLGTACSDLGGTCSAVTGASELLCRVP